MPHFPNEIEYSDKYADDCYEFRHVMLPKMLPKHVYKNEQKHASGQVTVRNCLKLSEMEWRSLGVQQSRGWAHYE